jgi:hypothetical protein
MLVVLVALVAKNTDRSAPAAVPDGGSTLATPRGAPPDISKMTPRQRFDRLYQRVINAAQQGDQATVQQFTPMAVAAFGQLDQVDADARYHLAMLLLHVGDAAGAALQADSILRTQPDHLFGFVIRGAVARWTKSAADRDASYRDFLARYDRELKTKKPEYVEHEAMLAEVKKDAAAAAGAPSTR